MSYKERSVWASLFILVYIWYDYFKEIFHALTGNTLSVKFINELLFDAIVLSIVLEIALQIVISIIDNKDTDYSEDERDKEISYRATTPAYALLFTGIVIAIFHTVIPSLPTHVFPNSNLPNDYFVLNIIIVFALASEVVRFIKQIHLYRRGF